MIVERFGGLWVSQYETPPRRPPHPARYGEWRHDHSRRHCPGLSRSPPAQSGTPTVPDRASTARRRPGRGRRRLAARPLPRRTARRARARHRRRADGRLVPPSAARPVLERLAPALGRSALLLTDERLRVLWAGGGVPGGELRRDMAEREVGHNSAALALRTRRRAPRCTAPSTSSTCGRTCPRSACRCAPRSPAAPSAQSRSPPVCAPTRARIPAPPSRRQRRRRWRRTCWPAPARRNGHSWTPMNARCAEPTARAAGGYARWWPWTGRTG